MKKRHAPRLLRRGLALATAGAVAFLSWAAAPKAALPTGLHTGETLAKALLSIELSTPQENDVTGWEHLLTLESPAMALPDPAPEKEPEPETPAPETPGNAAPPEPEPPAQPEAKPMPEESTETSEEAPDTSIPQEEEAPLDLSGIKGSDIIVDNHTASLHPNAGKYLAKDIPLSLNSADKGPQILIMHTHTTEAYTMDGEDTYKESDPARTTDNNYNMVRVGEEMKTVFEDMGLSVVHDTTAYDYPGYNGSYGRSLAGIQSYLEKYPTIQVVLDVHRDALIDSKGTVYAKTADIDGEKTAQVMLVVGTNDSGLNHPDWKNHFNLAVHLQAAMLALNPKLPREIDLRSQRFNQHVTPGSLLVEVGTSGNTLQEALAGARRFAHAAGEIYLGCVNE